MEYLEMRGAVRLKMEVDRWLLTFVFSRLLEIEFDDAGSMEISLEGRVLRLYAEGTIFESRSIRALLSQLQTQLTVTSRIEVSSIRWETNVVLKHWEPLRATPFHPTTQLTFAQ